MSKEKEDKDIRYYLNMVRSRLPLFIIPLLAVGAISWGISFGLPKIYEAHTTVLIQQSSALRDSMGRLAPSPSIGDWLNTMREEILSWPNLASIATDMGLLKKNSNLLSETKETQKVLKKLEENIKITTARNTLIQIFYQDKDPYLAQKIVQTITDKYIEKKLKEQREQTFGAVTFLEQQLTSYQKKLEESENALQQFKNKHLLELPGTEQSNLTKLGQVQTELRTTELDLAEAEKLKESLQKQLSGEQEIIVSETVKKANLVISQLTTRLRDLQLQLSNALATCTEKHPMVIQIRREIDETKAQIAEEEEGLIDGQIKDVEMRIDSLNARKTDLIRMSEELKKMVENVPEMEQQLAKLNRELETNKNMYELFKKNLETARISREIEAEKQGAKFEIIEPARIPIKPAKPNKLKIILMGLFSGGMLGLGLVYLSEYSDHSFRTLEDASNFLDKPILGAIPEIVSEKGKKKKSKIKALFSFVKNKENNPKR